MNDSWRINWKHKNVFFSLVSDHHPKNIIIVWMYLHIETQFVFFLDLNFHNQYNIRYNPVWSQIGFFLFYIFLYFISFIWWNSINLYKHTHKWITDLITLQMNDFCCWFNLVELKFWKFFELLIDQNEWMYWIKYLLLFFFK